MADPQSSLNDSLTRHQRKEWLRNGFILFVALSPVVFAFLKTLLSDGLSWSTFTEQLLNSLILGSVYALVAIGYTMVYGVVELINFANSEVYMMGAFLAALMVNQGHIPFLLAVPLAIVAAAILGVMIELIAYRPLRHADRLSPLISALGVSLFLQNFALILWGANRRPFFPAEGTEGFTALDGSTLAIITFLGQKAEFFGVKLSYLSLLILMVSLASMATLTWFVRRTSNGKAMRAVAQDMVAARLMGIDVDKIISLTFAIGSALAAIAGILLGIYYESVEYTMGFLPGTKAFSAAVLGGIGNIPGAMVGGILIGVSEGMGAGYISSGYKDAIALILLILVLMIKPSGILGKLQKEKV